MRIVASALRKCWILIQSLNVKEASDLDSDEGPLRKHRRLSLDHWTAVASTASMDRLKRSTEGKKSNDTIKSGRLTRDVGILCNDLVPVNDKCIMVGTTGIAALKAKYGDDFTNFEIIQDVGYSSESSTHLSGDDGIGVGGDRYFNIRVYNYNNATPTMSLREELQNATNRKFRLFGSSLESSSPGTSLDDSGLGTAELFATEHSSGLNISDSLFGGTDGDRRKYGVDEEAAYGPEDEYLENVLDHYVDFIGGEKEECSADENLHFDLSGIESDDPADNFHNRSSFTTSAQNFYKILSVDSDNGDLDSRGNENSSAVDNRDMKPVSSSPSESKRADIKNVIELALPLTSTPAPKEETKFADTDSEPDTYKPVANPKTGDEKEKSETYDRKVWRSSTPVRHNQDDRFSVSYRHQTLKRKRDSESTDFATTWQGGGRTTNYVRTWAKRCADYQPHHTRRSLFRNGNDQRNTSPNNRQSLATPFVGEDASSCDASGEYTSSSADEGNAFSSSSSFFEDETFHFKTRLDSYSAEGSIETVLPSRHCQRRTDLEFSLLLPPPPSFTPPSSVICRRHNASTSNIGHDHVCNSICKEPRLKASSEGDIRIRAIRKMKDQSTLSNNTSGGSKCNRPHATTDPKSCLYSSLPSMLRFHSDSSTDDCRAFSLSHSDTKMTYVCSTRSTNHSSSSEVGKRKRRRSRRKSSSSNRSSMSILLSGDNSGRHRSRTLTSGTAVSLSCCGSRRRHFSQRSDFFAGSEHVFSDGESSQSEVKIPPDELDRENMNTGLELILDNSCARRDSSVLLSNVESDVVLTQLEEQSTVSDQVWDGYQDMPYLSEAYSEATVDEDAVRKLTEFGDDYGSAIGLPRLLDSADGNNNTAEAPRSPSKKSSKSLPLPASQRLSSLSNDSDSDTEDLHHVIEEAGKALQFAKAAVKGRQSGDFFTSAEYAELLATCGTHLGCLESIYETIEIDGKKNNFSASDLKKLQYSIKEWEILRKSIEMYEKAEDHVQQKYLKAQENIDALFNKMSELSSLTHVDTKNFNSWEELKSNLTKFQMVLSTLQETKEQLLAVNLQVHRFTTEHGDDLSYKDCSLKEDITELYRQWEDTYEQNGAQLTEMQTLSNRWEAYDVKYQKLRSKVKEAELSSNEDYDTITAVKNVDGQLRKELKELQYEAGFLESRLKGGALWNTIDQNLRDLSRRIDKQTRISPASRSAHHQISSVSVEDDTDDHFEDAIQQLEDDRKDIITTPSHSIAKENVDVAKKSGPSRFWRVVRVAVPVQFALVLLYCLACYLEPHCCDMLNNFNFSLSPQLRYLRGPPPV